MFLVTQATRSPSSTQLSISAGAKHSLVAALSASDSRSVVIGVVFVGRPLRLFVRAEREVRHLCSRIERNHVVSRVDGHAREVLTFLYIRKLFADGLAVLEEGEFALLVCSELQQHANAVTFLERGSEALHFVSICLRRSGKLLAFWDQDSVAVLQVAQIDAILHLADSDKDAVAPLAALNFDLPVAASFREALRGEQRAMIAFSVFVAHDAQAFVFQLVNK